MGNDSMDGPDPQGPPPQGGPKADGATSAATSQQGVVIPTPGQGCSGGEAGDNQDLHCLQSEHNFPVHRGLSYIGDVSVVIDMTRGTGTKVVVGTGGAVLGRRVIVGDGYRGGREG